jgi:4'-phosphopantetheinyl transferase
MSANSPRELSDLGRLAESADAWHMEREKLPTRILDVISLSWLDPGEQAYFQKIPRAEVRLQYLATRILCRRVLSHYAKIHPTEWRFAAGAHGKPRIARPRAFSSLRFNLTHTRGLIVCLVSRAGEVGVDVEEISRKVDIVEIIRHFFARSEREMLDRLTGATRTRRFFELWVLKEAYLKARGRGLSISPQRIPIHLDESGEPAPIRDWQLALHRPTPRHVAATAIRSPQGRPIAVRWHDAAQLFKAGIAVE